MYSQISYLQKLNPRELFFIMNSSHFLLSFYTFLVSFILSIKQVPTFDAPKFYFKKCFMKIDILWMSMKIDTFQRGKISYKYSPKIKLYPSYAILDSWFLMYTTDTPTNMILSKRHIWLPEKRQSA